MSLDDIIALAKAGRMRDARAQAAELAAALPAAAHPFRDRRSLEDAAIHHEHGALAWATARFDESAAALARAYQLRVASLGEDHPLTLATIQRQAALAHYQDRRDDARALFVRVIEGLEAALGPRDVELAIARRNYAAFLRDAGDTHAARAELDRAVPVIERVCGKEHPSYAAALKVDATLAIAEGVEWRALRRAELAIAACRRCHAAHHPYTAAAHLIAARAEFALDRYADAYDHVAIAIEDLEAGYGHHPLLAIALCCASGIDFSGGGDLDRAEASARRALAIYQETYRNHSVVGVAHQLWTVVHYRGNWVDAGAAAIVCAEHSGDDSTDFADYLNTAAADYHRAGGSALARERLAALVERVADPHAREWIEHVIAHGLPPAPVRAGT